MKLTPKEEERLTVFTAAEVARRRKERGVLLSHPETVAYISDWCIERARDGESVAEIRSQATRLLGRDDVMEGVPEMIDMIQVEPMFPDGTKLVTVHDPIRADSVGDNDGVDTDDAGDSNAANSADDSTDTDNTGASTDTDDADGEASAR